MCIRDRGVGEAQDEGLGGLLPVNRPPCRLGQAPQRVDGGGVPSQESFALLHLPWLQRDGSVLQEALSATDLGAPDHLLASGDSVALRRTLETRDGRPVDRPLWRLAPRQLGAHPQPLL